MIEEEVQPKKNDHHTNPKLALKGFAKNGVLRKMDKNYKVGQSGIKVATVEKNFYTIWGSKDPDAVEDLMWELFETPAAPLFREIVDNHKWPLDNNENFILSNFLSLQLLRSPAVRNTFIEGMKRVYELSFKISNNEEYILNPQKIRDIEISHMLAWWRKDGIIIADIFFKMRKILFIFEDDSLLTSDQPISMLFRSSSIFYEDSNGELVSPPYVTPYGDPRESEAVFYSLSRKIGLIMLPPYYPELNDFITIGDEHLAAVFNGLASMFSDEVFFHPDDTEYMKENLIKSIVPSDAVDLLVFIDIINPHPDTLKDC
jgi:hypothetical protein